MRIKKEASRGRSPCGIVLRCAPYGRIKMHGSNMVVESHAIKN
jgi:hypothetical protein